MIEISLKSSDLLYLSASIYEVNNAIASIIVIPGLNEYKTRYQDLVNYFNNANFNVYIYDPRGQGKSINEANPLGYISDSKSLVKDLNIFINTIYGRSSNLPIYVLGDSLGALIALNYLKDNKIIAKFVLSSPLLDSNAKANLKKVNLLMNVFGKTKESPFVSASLGLNKAAVIVKDQNEIERIKNDPLCNYNYKNISIYRIIELENDLNSLKELPNNPKILIQTGMLDITLSGKEKVSSLINHLNSLGLNNISFLEYPNMGHKILFETGKSLVYQDILNFFIN